jgi:hypothetical protein
MNNSHKTAKTRNKLSAPMQYLLDNELILSKGNYDNMILDYGCGKGSDADALLIDSYDPYYAPTYPTAKYDIITCNYVLNVIESTTERSNVLSNIKSLLKPGGVAYVSVRRDKMAEGYTKTGTYQATVKLDLPIVTEQKGKYIIYKL